MRRLVTALQPGSGAGTPIVTSATIVTSVRDAERCPDLFGRSSLDAGEPGREPLVDRREQEHHQRSAGIDEPERDRPVDLLATGRASLSSCR